ncbi:hypothetical protein Acr_10g0007500 [Actinidia rufa]|uniref:Uncharacterized protein n=1 Tax=Actinidia rufa TaxID=165716 RepID=A0A7J0F9L8_9ERIC|nr:hypothetical protein Acr_10g0007500 [Actinidia rufa]
MRAAIVRQKSEAPASQSIYAYLEDDIEEEDISPTGSGVKVAGVDMAIKLERKERNASIAIDQCVWARR